MHGACSRQRPAVAHLADSAVTSYDATNVALAEA